MTVSAMLLLLAPSPGNGPIGSIVMFAGIFAIFYLVMIRPQAAQRKKQEERLRSLKKGDEIVTAGGLVGEIIHIKESVKDGQPVRAMDDRITIRSGESRLVVERGRIASVVSKTVENPSA
ncbi:MAG: preprotein translocase subunit YajC [Gemmatimonadota bacterium]|nr:preprotein translocase subunit YajC [Gemmatimonadota bacterium]